MEDCNIGQRSMKEREKVLGGILTHRLGAQVIKITYDDAESKEMPQQYMGTFAELLELPFTYNFEFLMQTYFTTLEWRDFALKELAKFRQIASDQILSDLREEVGKAEKVKAKMATQTIDEIVKIEDLPTLEEVRGRKKTPRKPGAPRKPKLNKEDAELLGFTTLSTPKKTTQSTPRKPRARKVVENPDEPMSLADKRSQKAKAKQEAKLKQ
jgi:hypothetical protein